MSTSCDLEEPRNLGIHINRLERMDRTRLARLAHQAPRPGMDHVHAQWRLPPIPRPRLRPSPTVPGRRPPSWAALPRPIHHDEPPTTARPARRGNQRPPDLTGWADLAAAVPAAWNRAETGMRHNLQASIRSGSERRGGEIERSPRRFDPSGRDSLDGAGLASWNLHDRNSRRVPGQAVGASPSNGLCSPTIVDGGTHAPPPPPSGFSPGRTLDEIFHEWSDPRLAEEPDRRDGHGA